MNLSRNGLIVLISIIFVAGAGTAYAGIVLPTITLAGNVVITGDTEPEGKLLDTNDDAGTSGQLLSSIETGIDWIDATGTGFTTQICPDGTFVIGINSDGTIVCSFDKLDLVVTNVLSDNMSILLGNGDGSFGAATNFAAGFETSKFDVGDFNGDTKLDLAVSDPANDSVVVLLGNGDGSFGAPTTFPVGFAPNDVAVGDFNGDTKLDLATANTGTNDISILLGTGTGSFGTATNFPSGSSAPEVIVVGDFNGDTKLDLVVINQIGNLSILLGTGTGSFGTATNFSAGTRPSDVAVADFNGDTKLDLVVSNRNSDNVSILLGDGAGSFGAPTNFNLLGGTSPMGVAVGDFNGDTKLDLAVANDGSNSVSILLGDGAGSFGTATNFPVGKPSSVAVGDFNRDLNLDLAIAKCGADSVSILLGDGAGSFGLSGSNIFLVGDCPIGVTVGNFDGS